MSQSLAESQTFLDLANLVATRGIRYFVETNAAGSADGLETATRLGLQAHVLDANERNAAIFAQRYPNADLYDGNAADFLAHVLPQLDGPAFFWLSRDEERAVVEAESGERDWHFEMKQTETSKAFSGIDILPIDAPKAYGQYDEGPKMNPDGTPSDFDRNFVGPPELAPRVYRSQSEKDTWYAVVVENEYQCPKFAETDIVIDIGANIGSFVKRAHVMGSRRIYGLEPSAYYFEACVENVGDLDGVQLCHGAVVRSDEKRKAQYFHDGGMSTICDSGEAVESVSLDDLLQDTGPIRFLKIDCEGSEYEILYTSKLLHLVGEIAGEFHLGNFGAGLAYEPTITGLEKCLRANGFDHIVFVQNAASTGNFYARRRHEALHDYSLGN